MWILKHVFSNTRNYTYLGFTVFTYFECKLLTEILFIIKQVLST